MSACGPSALVSVITPMFNGIEHIEAAVRSVRNQTYPNLEHIVVDDGSTDDGPALVEALMGDDSRLRLMRQTNAGLSAARNAGWRASDPRAQFLLFLDHDDVLRPNCLELLLAALQEHPDLPAAHGRNAAIDAAGQPVPLVREAASNRRTIDAPQRWAVPRKAARVLADTEPSMFASLAYVLFIYTPGQVLIRRQALERIGDFDPNMRLAQDYDMWLRLAALGPLAYVPEVVIDYRQTEGSMSSATHLTRREDLVGRFRAMTDPTNSAVVHTIGRQMHRHHELHRAMDRLGLARAALRAYRFRDAGTELARAGRSLIEGLLALIPGSALPRWRLARLARQLSP
jgi:GT2 family glycosyltransferase